MVLNPPERPGRRAWWLALALAAVFLAAHLPFLASTLEDLDSLNFALGVRDFDPGQHRPHPPGYPVFIALGKAARVVLNEPHALAVWAALFGALAAFPLLRLFQALDRLEQGSTGAIDDAPWWSPACLATLVTVVSPLYWMTAVRPMSDSVGLAVSLLAQALLVTGFVRQFHDMPDARGRFDPAVAARSARVILLGALVAGFAIGVRSQALWLTVPLLVVVLASRVGRGAAGALIGSVAWFAAGALAWFVPLIVASGGPTKYLAALGSQAGEDWSGVDLLATHLSSRRLAFGLLDTFITHWAGLGWIVFACAVAGAVVQVIRGRRTLGVLIAAFAPYAAFHLLFQESVTTRYALPLVVPVAYLAVRGVRVLGRWPMRAAVAACVVYSLVRVVPVTVQYSRVGSPASRAIADITAEAARRGPVTLGRHFMFARALEAELDSPAITVIKSRPRQAWQGISTFLATDGRTPLWTLDTPRHANLTNVDPHGRIVRRAYRWPFDVPTFLGGVRPGDVDWIELRDPSWFVMEGWHLTPDTAGIAAATGQGMGNGPIKAMIRPSGDAAVVMIGGRHLGAASDAALAFTLRLGDRTIESWTVTPASPFFLRVLPMPAGALVTDQRWMTLSVEARDVSTGRYSPAGAIEQFGLAPLSRAMIGYAAGWNEQELNTVTGRAWRWSSGRADLQVVSAGGDVTVQIDGESPLKTFGRPSHVTVRCGTRVLFDDQVSADFGWRLRVSGADLAAAGGVVTVTTDQTFRPFDRGENADHRTLGLRVYTVSVTPAS